MKKTKCSENEIIIDFFKIGYSSLGIDPMSQIWFYTYSEPDVKIRLDSKKVSRLLPREYEEFIIRYLQRYRNI